MSHSWFFTQFPRSRSAIESALRLSFWQAGFGRMWFTCTKEEPPFECQGLWREKEFTVEWEPKNYLLLKMKEPDQDLMGAFERVLKHGALAAYKNGGGSIVVEWRAKNAGARFQELQASGVSALERLDI
jgi:hypothetical protein